MYQKPKDKNMGRTKQKSPFKGTFIEKLFLCHLAVRKRTFKASGQQEFIYSDAYVLFSGGSWIF